MHARIRSRASQAAAVGVGREASGTGVANPLCAAASSGGCAVRLNDATAQSSGCVCAAASSGGCVVRLNDATAQSSGCVCDACAMRVRCVCGVGYMRTYACGWLQQFVRTAAGNCNKLADNC